MKKRASIPLFGKVAWVAGRRRKKGTPLINQTWVLALEPTYGAAGWKQDTATSQALFQEAAPSGVT